MGQRVYYSLPYFGPTLTPNFGNSHHHKIHNFAHSILDSNTDEQYSQLKWFRVPYRPWAYENFFVQIMCLSAIGEHSINHNHQIKIDDVQVIAREDHFWKRKIREAIEIRTQKPTLNRDAGYDLPAIYDDLLSHDRSLMGGHVTRRDSTQRWMKRSWWPRKLRPATTRLWKGI